MPPTLVTGAVGRVLVYKNRLSTIWSTVDRMSSRISANIGSNSNHAIWYSQCGCHCAI